MKMISLDNGLVEYYRVRFANAEALTTSTEIDLPYPTMSVYALFTGFPCGCTTAVGASSRV